MDSDPQVLAIDVQGVSKTFRLPHEKTNSIKGAVLNFYRKNRTYEIQQALKDVSFDIKKGEFFGIVGRNGSGKSTLLKLLAGIYEPTKGGIRVEGQLTPFIELGVGFNPELTGKENVFLNGALLGFNRKQMASMYKDIVKFAELERFMDQKLKNYSSGMQVRLAFSIAIRARSDILLIDEVLAVGDESFQQKCYAVFEKLKAQRKTIVFVSHDMGAIQRFCNRAVFIDSGEVVDIGHPKKIADLYNKMNQASTTAAIEEENKNLQSKPSRLQITISDSNGKEATLFDYDETLIAKVTWPKDLEVHNVGLAIYKQSGEYVFGANTILDKFSVANSKLVYKVDLSIGNGNYFIVAGLFGKTSKDIIDTTPDGPHFQVVAKKAKKWEGMVHLNHEWSP